MHLSEDDIRTKVVYEWLKDIGVSKDEIFVEKTITLVLGRGTHKINSRADVLVKNAANKNLLLVEVKKDDHSLKTGDELQALSYARSLHDGIAPFTILTNGSESKIFDSVSGEALSFSTIPKDHHYVKSGFQPTGDAIAYRREALEYLISLSKENLNAFCKGQQEFRMSLLKGSFAESGKKYIPSLFVERKKQYDELHEKLIGSEKRRNLILLVGPPQHGKTCFMCNSAERLLSEGHPVLFYPAIGLNSGLFQSINEDFDWCFGEHMQTHQWINRVNNIGQTLNKRVFLFVDGWNEMTYQKALEINYECQRLKLDHIAIVISTTSSSLENLLIDEAGNLTYVAESAKLNHPSIKRLTTEPLKDSSNLGIVQIGRYDQGEISKAKELYARAFNVKFNEISPLLFDPFYLRIAAEQYSGRETPKDITQSGLIKASLIAKARRRGIKEVDLYAGLSQLASIFFELGRSIPIIKMPMKFQSDMELNRWQESAILTAYDSEQGPLIDFYYTHDLNYAIGVVFRDWGRIFNCGDENGIVQELHEAINTDAGQSALSWFLGLPENVNVLKRLFQSVKFEDCFNLPAGKLLSDAIIKQVTVNEILEFEWLDIHLDKLIAMDMNENAHVSEIPELLFSLLKSFDWKEKPEAYEFWMRQLVKYDNSAKEIGVKESFIHMLYGGGEEEIRSYSGYDDGDSSLDTDLFLELMLDPDCEVASKAAFYYAYACGQSLLEDFKLLAHRIHKLGGDPKEVLYDACDQLTYDLGDQYYGYSMCAGWLIHAQDEIPDESVANEYHRMKELLPPIINAFPNTGFPERLNNMLLDLKRIGGIKDDDESGFDRMDFEDPDQLKFGF